MSIESFVIDNIEERKKTFLLKELLYVISLCFRIGSKVRHFLYDRNLLKTFSSQIPVVSIGNIVAGGTGKTPFARKLIKDLEGNPGDIAILSRGYRSKRKGKISFQVSEGFGPEVPSDISGDEPYWLALETNASIWVGRDRVQSALLATKAGARLLILEDGFQHRQLKRNIEIVLLDASDLFGRNHFLPRGYLRDSPKRLSKADFIVVTRLEENHSKQHILEEIRRFTDVPVLGFKAKYQVEESIKGKKVAAFCGIAKPESFYSALKSLGFDLVNSFTSVDHVMPSCEELEIFASIAKIKGAECLLCTEKDYVKYPVERVLPLPMFVLKMDLECIWNEDVWEKVIESIKNINFC